MSSISSLEQKASETIARLREARDVAGVEEILEGVSGYLRPGADIFLWLAREGEHWSEGLLQRLARESTGTLPLLLQNPAVSQDESDRLLAHLASAPHFANCAERLLEVARQGLIAGTSRAIAPLLDELSPTRQPARALEILLEVPDLPEEAWGRMVRRSQQNLVMQQRLMEGRFMPPLILELALREIAWSEPVLQALARNPRARRHPALRPTLLHFGSYRSAEVLVELAREAEAAELRQLFRRARGRYGERVAVRVLEVAPTLQEVGLAQEELLSLLASEDAEVRLAAIRVSEAAGQPCGAVRGRRPARVDSLRRSSGRVL